MQKQSIRLLIHVGMPKAGSTAFQDWCSDSSAILSGYGIHYPGPDPENASFFCNYLKSPSPEILKKTLEHLNVLAAECSNRNLHTLLLSSEQIFEFASSLNNLCFAIYSSLEAIQSLSILVITRDFGEIEQSSWKQSVLAAGEYRELDEYAHWMRSVFKANLKALTELDGISLITYKYSRPLDFIDLFRMVSSEKKPVFSIVTKPDHDRPALGETNHLLSNQTLPDSCYKFWLSCNRAYARRAHCISLNRFELMQSRPYLRKYLLNNSGNLKSQKILLIIEASALKKFFLMSEVERAATLIHQFMAHATDEQQQGAMEFLLINDDYLYEPMFGRDHAELIISQISGASDRTIRFLDILHPKARLRGYD